MRFTQSQFTGSAWILLAVSTTADWGVGLTEPAGDRVEGEWLINVVIVILS
jgi:hypothetical protein